tara:strand:+ start:1174 stop:1629 length:456 start_codon:yes stop_codon:yes gene_type:complete
MKDLNEQLFDACTEGDIDEVESLIENGADVNAVDEYFSSTALMHVSRHGNVKIANLLINKGADVNVYDGGGWTALMHASRHGNVKIANLLIKKGADVNANVGDVNVGDVNVGDVNANVDDFIIYGDTSLRIAVENQEIEIIKLLVKAGARE